MNEGLTEAIEGVVKFTNDYMAKVQAELKVVTEKIEKGTFTANDAFDGMLRAATLWVSGVAGAAVESMDFATTLTKYLGVRTITTPALKVGKAGAWKLALTPPFTNAQKASLDPSTLALSKDHVDDGQTETFTVSAKVTGDVGAGVYGGVVTATETTSGELRSLPVKIQVS